MQSLFVRFSTLSAAAFAATCVSDTSVNTTAWPISGYVAVASPVSGTAYDIDSAWQAAHGFNSTLDLSMTHDANMTDYAEFKCQFACNENAGCVAFFGRFVNVDTDEEKFQCMSFKALLDSSSFTTSTSNMANGAYNKLCT